MNVLIDAMLPGRLSEVMENRGVDTLHTLDLPKGNRTSDRQIVRLAEAKNLIVISKDDDFLDRHLREDQPEKFLLVKTGNIGNDELIDLFERHLEDLKKLFSEFDVIQLDTEGLKLYF